MERISLVVPQDLRTKLEAARSAESLRVGVRLSMNSAVQILLRRAMQEASPQGVSTVPAGK
ncbi:hypothetical protein [Burkholderia gladioli]|uniref:hypothetical protein n=1 Tax=Burkholderia gladioli TaxID=28095 RepID=UPI0016413F63|nr:hypothetical protein [Burkholderia gladioli]